MQFKKSSVGLERAYAYFLSHSSQERLAVEQSLLLLADQLPSRQMLRVCFLGCGNVGLLVGLAESLAQAYELAVTLVDPHADWRGRAALEVARCLGRMPEDAATLLTPVEPYDLIVAHHTLYYVPNLGAAVLQLRDALAPDGVMLTMLAEASNGLRACATQLFALKEQTLPYWSEEDLGQELAAAGLASEATVVTSQIDCPDDGEARSALTRFLTGETFGDNPDAEALAVYAPYKAGNRLKIPMHDVFRVIRRVPKTA